MPSSPLVTTLLASFLSVLEAALVCGAGAALAHVGVLNAACRHALAKVGFYVLLPAITFVKAGKSEGGEAWEKGERAEGTRKKETINNNPPPAFLFPARSLKPWTRPSSSTCGPSSPTPC